MTTPILICDDSSVARKQMARALPQDWDVDIKFAANGVEALAAIGVAPPEILFLDLNMPEMDGYEVLKTMRKMDLPTTTIVVSGDIQPEAHQRVTRLGALDFIKKPIASGQIEEVLHKYGIPIARGQQHSEIEVKVDFNDAYQEVANIAMGRAGDLLARLLDAFVLLPVPNVNTIEPSELNMALSQVEEDDSLSVVCQGFIGSGIAGESLLIFNETSFTDIAELMKFEGEITETAEMELVMDISNILIGACLKGFADQLDINFSQGHPIILGRHVRVRDIIQQNLDRWNKTLAIEIAFSIENKNVNCDLLLLFTEDSIDSLNDRISYILD